MTDYQLKKTPNYLYLIKLFVFLASELCGVAVRGRAIVQKRRVRFRITSGYDFFFGFWASFFLPRVPEESGHLFINVESWIFST